MRSALRWLPVGLIFVAIPIAFDAIRSRESSGNAPPPPAPAASLSAKPKSDEWKTTDTVTPPPERPAPVRRDGGLDPALALQAAQDAGLRAALLVPDAVPCPVFAPPAAGAPSIKATGALARFQIDADAFRRESTGIAEAVALLGRPVLCNNSVPGYFQLHVAPLDPDVQEANLETKDDDLIGIIVELTKPVDVDLAALEATWGKRRETPATGTHRIEWFDRETPEFRANFGFRSALANTTPQLRPVDQILFRRSATRENLPETFRSEGEVVRLLTLALWRRPPDSSAFFGTLGAAELGDGGAHVAFTQTVERNLADASLEQQSQGGRRWLQSMHIRFEQPIATDGPALARALAAAIHTPAPAIAKDGTKTTLRFTGRGSLTIEAAANGVTGVDVARER